MNVRRWLLAALVLALALPGALRAQDAEARRGSGYMGIYFGWDDQGRAEVREVVRGSPADRAGVRSGDLVVRLNGRAPTRQAVDELRESLDRGDSVRLRVRHDGEEADRLIVAAARPRTMVYGLPGTIPGTVWSPGDRRIVIRMDTIAGRIDSLVVRMDSLRSRLRTRHRGDSLVIHMDTVYRVLRDSLRSSLPRASREFRTMVPFLNEFGSRSVAGAEFAEMNAGLGRYFHTNEGLLVLQVGAQTPSARGGLQAGDVVVEAAGRKVERVRDLRDAFTRAAGQEVRLTVLRDGRRQQLSVRWEQPRTRTFRYDTERGELLEPTRRP
ncbi:MAG TPA: PDZ domain-containing protein [Longimicrobium sp.]|jgi:S1-C subfamily serine protease|nr:PDZ domain-containing protein [Longimicrobium sp.]